MRTKPWKMAGIGSAPFKITSLNPEVQGWYDQGNALLHSFWFEEAERSFRWCHKLDPENAMVYFGLARCGLQWFTAGAGKDPSLKRYHEFLQEAVKRKATVSERERMYIEAWDASWSMNGDAATRVLISRLEQICQKYPDDLEAKAQLAFFTIGKWSPLANEFLVQSIFRVNPKHPGAHHARIHNWDGKDGHQAIESCRNYGIVAPKIGHSRHMPGHIYSKVGMWHEAANSMDSATRVELKYMNDRMALPFETWNYAHNRDYLCYIQEQLGRADASVQGALDMMNAPRDPSSPMGDYPAVIPLFRAQIKFERWNEILDGRLAAPGKANDPMGFGQIAETFALIGLGRVGSARAKLDEFMAGLSKQIEAEIKVDPKNEARFRQEMEANMPLLVKTAQAKMLIAEGKRDQGIDALKKVLAAENFQRAQGMYANDPPFDPWPTARIVADFYVDEKNWAEAIKYYDLGLKAELNDAWCLAGLAKSYAESGDKARATEYAGRFAAVWDGADPGLRLTKEVASLGLNAKPKAMTLEPERRYDPVALDKIGPSNWQPFPAPKLDCITKGNRRVTLDEYRGKNVLLVYYLSDQCAHCMEQLAAINARLAEFTNLDTSVMAVSAALPGANEMSEPLAPFNIMLLSDPTHANARRFASYDDFEDMELHSTILIDRQGRVRWKRAGGEPFSDVPFLLNEIKRWWK